MKVNVVRDQDGKVVATYENPVGDGPALRPVLKAGHTTHEVDAEDNYTARIEEFYKRHSR